jgi:hypothetical protein
MLNVLPEVLDQSLPKRVRFCLVSDSLILLIDAVHIQSKLVILFRLLYPAVLPAVSLKPGMLLANSLAISHNL